MQREEFETFFYGKDPLLGYGIDLPVRFEVWLNYATDKQKQRHDVMLNAGDGVLPEQLAQLLLKSLDSEGEHDHDLAVSGAYVAVSLHFDQLVRHVMPLTSLSELLTKLRLIVEQEPERVIDLVQPDREAAYNSASPNDDSDAVFPKGSEFEKLTWFTRLLLATFWQAFEGKESEALAVLRVLTKPSPGLVVQAVQPTETGNTGDAMVESVTINRQASSSVQESRKTVKADAAAVLFEVSCASLTWAVLDSGIDAGHPAFRRPDGRSRVTATYDFTGIRAKLAPYGATRPDWARLKPKLRLPHIPDNAPTSDHGTHVAGILAANLPEMQGVCPDINLWDIRVLNEEGKGNEFDILNALEFLRWANDQHPHMTIVGANLSFSLPHEVANYSCGWTPICVECDRLVRSGVVVVTVAGNAAFGGAQSGLADGTSYRAISITDPGNADSVITVGATHRTDPHRHGVSFFSGRGPTADGRPKPDLLAPGERIEAPIPGGGRRRMTGTSQAAPHVSGAAALLMARHRELLGRPERVKEILCGSATDLGRDKTFQGHGMLDVLRAMQAL